MKKSEISIDVLRECFLCDPARGLLFWRERPRGHFKDERSWKTWNTSNAGREAFTYCFNNGYKQGRLFDIGITAHRIIWAMTTGSWAKEIDYINGNRTDNRIQNLRSVTRTENCHNHSLSRRNKTGVTGVSFCAFTGMWRASITYKRCAKNLGRFDSFADAVSARKCAEEQLGFHPNHGRGKNMQSSLSNP